jgi:TRAP-type uncharacterized transport system fused permease subunit
VTRTGLDFLIPLVVLLWCLMVEEMSPGPLGLLGDRHHHRHPGDAPAAPRALPPPAGRAGRAGGAGELVDGLALGARNMIGSRSPPRPRASSSAP